MSTAVIVDAFAHRVGEGNRAAVIRCAALPSDEVMGATAHRLGEPITVFVEAGPGPAGPHRMRWFAPHAELMSCGHGTVAAAHLLLAPGGGTLFHTRLGPVPARRRGGLVEIDMPAEQLTPWAVDDLDDLLGITPVATARSARHGLIVLDSPDAVRDLRPDLIRLAELPVVGLAFTAYDPGPDYDIVSRWFVPRLGIEDQATGTAHCLLGPYWSAHRGLESLRARQESAHGADIEVTVVGDRVLLAGGAVTVGNRDVSDGRPSAGGPTATDRGAP